MHITLEEAASALKSGLVVAVPTETVYGLAASIDFPDAIEDIFRLKGRPSNNPLIVHVASAKEISFYTTQQPPHFSQLASTFWPGSLTVILPVDQDRIPAVARAGLPTAAFRVPNHPLTRELLEITGPLVMPSANISGKPSATTADHVEKDFGQGFSVLDGGACVQGVESTILYWEEPVWTIARLGALAPEAFLPILGYVPKIHQTTDGETSPLCPGQLYRHYSPHANLRLVDKVPSDLYQAVVGFEDREYAKNCRLYSLGTSSNPEMAAQRLYAVLRQLDLDDVKEAVVDMDFPHNGLWLTLRERLQKAAQTNK